MLGLDPDTVLSSAPTVVLRTPPGERVAEVDVEIALKRTRLSSGSNTARLRRYGGADCAAFRPDAKKARRAQAPQKIAETHGPLRSSLLAARAVRSRSDRHSPQAARTAPIGLGFSRINQPLVIDEGPTVSAPSARRVLQPASARAAQSAK